jgi:molybdopterin/thiamine biosynthesis adenylyltransferase
MANRFLDLRRHSELFDAEKFDDAVTVIGAGATGSWLVLQLANLGITNITVYDFDTVEEHNVPNQLYGLTDIGKPKVQALYEYIKEQTGLVIKGKNEKYEKQRLGGYVFLMVDSMAERKRIYEESIKMKRAVKLLVEPRMGLDVGRIYNVDPVDLTQLEWYEDTYYSDDEAEVSACGTSMTVITTAMAVASFCARQLINHVDGTPLHNEILLDFKFNNLFTATS